MARRLDEGYRVPPVYHRPLREDDVKFAPGAPKFHDVTPRPAAKAPGKPDKSKLGGSEFGVIDNAKGVADDIAEKVSVSHWVRALLSAICGTDVFSGGWGA
ncbi:hypothetical protein FPZ12_039950 [Amycolatopsis acidicola]|uniref:Uncharacterized protein n=1 Tax=Amycolatopsis acidicola TaxID=2596893 RepID=A0A5N0UQH8_9PSEU|nr:hypothetical protein [Amycolatopsis acidicola]KAA9151018.1 hypothetical protein FPZ12_039950 [Amycolatopsis acidicola]